jgi:hypothetical protein
MVEDSGTGIPAGSESRLFEAFSPQSRTGWAWDWRSAARLSKRIAVGAGRAGSQRSGRDILVRLAGQHANRILTTIISPKQTTAPPAEDVIMRELPRNGVGSDVQSYLS